VSLLFRYSLHQGEALATQYVASQCMRHLRARPRDAWSCLRTWLEALSRQWNAHVQQHGMGYEIATSCSAPVPHQRLQARMRSRGAAMEMFKKRHFSHGHGTTQSSSSCVPFPKEAQTLLRRSTFGTNQIIHGLEAESVAWSFSGS